MSERAPLHARLWKSIAPILTSEKNLRRMEQLFDFQDPHQNLEQAIQLAKNGHLLVIVANHQSHADALPIATLSGKVSQATGRDVLLPIAATLESGHQGSSITSLFEGMAPWMESHNVQMVPFMLGSHVAKYELDAEAKRDNKANVERILRARAEGHDLAWFPEGTVQSARRVVTDGRRSDTERYGMQEANETFGKIMASLIHQGPVVFLPVGIDGSHKLLDPDTKRPTVEVLAALGLAVSVGKEISPVATVTIGQPFTGVDIPQGNERRRDGTTVGAFIMRRVASLLPEGARGVYK